MPKLNKEYALNSYNLLYDAYGDDLPVSQEDFLSKLENDKDGRYRDNVYNLLADKYGENVTTKVAPNEFRDKFFVSDFQQEADRIQQESSFVNQQLNIIENGGEPESAPEEWLEEQNIGTGLYRKSKEKKLNEQYWKEQAEILKLKNKRIESDMAVEDRAFEITGLERQAIEEDDVPSLVEEGYDIDVINYIKKEKEFTTKKQKIYEALENNSDATLNLSLFNYGKLKEQGKEPEIDPNIEISINDSDFNKIRNYDDRVKYLQEQADLYVEQNKSKEGKKLGEETALRKEYYSKVAPTVLFDDDGTPSIFAIQNMARIKSEQIDAQILEISKELKSLYSKELENKEISDPNIRETYLQPRANEDQIRILQKQKSDLYMAKQHLENSLNKPATKSNVFSEFGHGVADTDWQDQLTLGIKSIAESVDLVMINKKYESGAQLTAAEQSVLDAFGIMNYAARKADISGAYEIGQGVAQMPAYMVGFAIGSPLYSSTKKAAQKVVGNVVKKQIKQQAIGKLGQWIVHTGLPGAIGTIPGTIMNPSTSIIKNTAQNMTDAVDIALTDEVDEIHGKYIEGTGEDFTTALRKGATSAYTENLFERSGTALLEGLGYPVKRLTGKIKNKAFFQKYLVGEYARLKNIAPKSMKFKNAITKTLEKAGFNGMVEEMFEEYGTNIANGILNGDDMGLDLHTFTVTLGTVAVWGGALGGIRDASYKLQGNNVRASYTDMTGKEQNVKIPKTTFAKIKEWEQRKEPISSEEINKILKEEKLDKKQTEFVLKYWKNDFTSKMVKDIKAKVEQEGKKEKTEEKKVKEEKKKGEPTTVDDAVDRNEFDDIDELNEVLNEAELKQESDDLIKKTKQKLEKTTADVKKKYHDDKAMTDEMIDFDQMGEGANITIQKKVGKEKLNIPAEVLSIDSEKARIKYKNGTEDILLKDDQNFRLFSNQTEELEDEGKEFHSKQNEGKNSYIQTKLKNGKFVYTKPIKTDVEGYYSIFRNEDGTWDIVDQEGNIQEIKGSKDKTQIGTIKKFESQSQILKELESKKEPTKRGQFIYATSGSGKSTLAKQQPDKYTDSDVLIAEEIKNNIDDFAVSDQMKSEIKNLDPKNLGNDFGNFILNLYQEERNNGVKKPTMEDVYSKVGKRINEELKKGKDVLTGTYRFIDKADQVFTLPTEVSEERKGKKKGALTTLSKKEKEAVTNLKFTPTQIKEDQYLSDVINKKTTDTKKEVKEPKKVKPAKDAFSGLKIKNVESKLNAEIERQENKLKEDAGKLQVGIPFADRRTYIIFLKGIRELLSVAKSFNDLINRVKKYLASNTEYSQEELNEIYDEIDRMIDSRDENIEVIKEMFASEKPFYEASKSINMSIEEKVNAHRKAFSSLFKNVSEETGQDKKALEKKLHDVVMLGTFDGMKNESDYLKALEKAKKDNPGFESMFDEMKEFWNFNRAISLFDFYRSARLVRQFGIVFTKDGVKIKTLNSEDATNDLSKKFNNHINKISVRNNNDELIDDPNRAIRYILNEYRNDKDLIDESSITQQKIKEFELQLKFLSDLTGIDQKTWENYFTPITNETEVYLRKETDDNKTKFEKVVFKDYRSMLSFDPNVLNREDINHEDLGIVSVDKTDGKYVDYEVYFEPNPKKIKKAPAIINALTKELDQSTLSKLQERVKKYFTKGEESKGVYSNIKKLASTVQETQNIGVDGIDVEGNRFNSFQLMSHLFRAAENLHKSKINNPLAKMYQEEGIPMEISIINGIANEKERISSKGDKITESEYWLSQMIMFQNAEQGKYQGILGQFGDKKTMYVAGMKHYDKPNMSELKDKFNDIEKARKFFNNIMLDGVTSGLFEGMSKQDRLSFLDQFMYNYAMNMQDILDIFHGGKESYMKTDENGNKYFSFVDVVKRAGSTNSTGYNLDPYVEGGVGTKFRFVSAIDNTAFADELGLSKEQFDGAAFYSGNMGDKIGVSMGTMYNKMDEYDGPVSSIKALFSTQKQGKRGLTKTNWYNIDVIAEAYKDYPDHWSHKIKALIDKHNIDLLSFDSGTKKLEQKDHLTLFDKDGNFLDISEEEMNKYAFDRNTADIYVQQDLRHESEPTMEKQSTQLMGNILPLQHASEMVSEMNGQVKATIEKLAKKLSSIDNTQDKLDFLETELENKDDDELMLLVQMGATLFEPAYKNKMISIIASKFSKDGLQKLSNRITTQELPADHTLEGYRPSQDGKHTLLPQIDVGIEGIRYDQKFESQEKALEEYKNNKEKYSDVKEWEIEDGIIPGEYVLSTRVPADDLHSHTLARARHKLNGNFTVLDKESQARSGSDYDGDQRFNQVLFRDKNGNIITNGVQANANNFLLNLVQDYQNPENLERILHPIQTDYFDSIIDLQNIAFDYADPQGLNDSRKNNIVGVVMKGILSDLSMMSAIIANHNITPKSQIKINNNLYTSQFAEDKDGSLRNAIGILQNLAFDNAKDPKIEALGLNEVTANMFVLLMITDPRVDKAENKKEFILNKTKQISDYMNSPLVQDFIQMKRESNGVLNKKDDKAVFSELNKKYGEFDPTRETLFSPEVDKLKKLYYASNDFQELKKYYALTKSFPNNVSELLQALNVVDSFTRNDLNFFDVSKLQDSKIPTFELVEESVRFAVNNLFNHAPELSTAGQMIFKDIVDSKKRAKQTKKSILSGKEIEAISRSLNQIIAVDAINRHIDWKNTTLERRDKDGKRLDSFSSSEIKRWQGKPLSLSILEKLMFETLPLYRQHHKGNKFLNSIQRTKVKEGVYSIKLADDYNFSQLTESELNEIRTDFDKLPEALKNVFTLHSFQKYGLGQSTFKGNYFILFSLDHRVKVSQLIESEVNKWNDGFITQDKLEETTSWILSMNEKLFGEYQKPARIKEAQKGIYDINTNPEYNIENETIKELLDIVSNTEETTSEQRQTKVGEVLNREGISFEKFKNKFKFEKKKFGKDYNVAQYLTDMLESKNNQPTFEKPIDLYNLLQKYKPCKF